LYCAGFECSLVELLTRSNLLCIVSLLNCLTNSCILLMRYVSNVLLEVVNCSFVLLRIFCSDVKSDGVLLEYMLELILSSSSLYCFYCVTIEYFNLNPRIFDGLELGPDEQPLYIKCQKKRSPSGYLDYTSIEKFVGISNMLCYVEELCSGMLSTLKCVVVESCSVGYILSGAAGTGKILLGQTLSSESSTSFYVGVVSQLMCFDGQTGNLRTRVLFDKLNEDSNAILFLDELDLVGSKRAECLSSWSLSSLLCADSGSRIDALTEFLVNMDGFRCRPSWVIVGTTEWVGCLDDSLVRPGRFDRIITLLRPSRSMRVSFFKTRIGVDVVWWDYFVKCTGGFNREDLCGVLNVSNLEELRLCGQGVVSKLSVFYLSLNRICTYRARSKRSKTSVMLYQKLKKGYWSSSVGIVCGTTEVGSLQLNVELSPRVKSSRYKEISKELDLKKKGSPTGNEVCEVKLTFLSGILKSSNCCIMKECA
jgi:hypothetical protein